jgi:hypothetical protein
MSTQPIIRLLLLLVIGFTFMLGAAKPALAAAPANDDFDAATVIGALPFSEASDVSEATAAADDPETCTNNGSVWYAFTPTVDMTVEANTFGSVHDTVLSAYTGGRGSLVQVPEACNDDAGSLQSRIVFDAQANTTYYFLIGICCGFGGSGHPGANLVFNVQEIAPALNDHFADATPIQALPYVDPTDTNGSTLEANEPTPSCAFGELTGTVWYAYTAPADGYVSANAAAFFFSTVVAAYTGTDLAALSEIGCMTFGYVTIPVQTGVTYYFQVSGLSGSGPLHFTLDLPPPPLAIFYHYPDPTSIYGPTLFVSNAYDPAGLGIATKEWDLGGGQTASGSSVYHQFTADGDYPVEFTVTTVDGRSATETQTISVRTHDVAITKLTLPARANVGQTRRIIVSLSNQRYPEDVEVYFAKSTAGGIEQIATLFKAVPVKKGKRTTDFAFRYTFTEDDARIGKVVFQAYAFIHSTGGWDAFPADNAASSFPIPVHSTAASHHDEAAAEITVEFPARDPGYAGEATTAPPPVAQQERRLFLPLVIQ